MSGKDANKNHSGRCEEVALVLKPYQPPRILSREHLESAADVCLGAGLKAQPTDPDGEGGLCGSLGIQS